MNSDWLVRYREVDAAPVRIFAFPHAGAGPAAFRALSDALPRSVEFVAAQLPGHGRRLAEPPFAAAAPLIAALAPVIAGAIDRPYCLFGHSMGAFVAYELARALHDHGLPPPLRLIVSGRRPPNHPAPSLNLHRLPDAAFVTELSRFYDGIPPAIRNDPELLALFLPVLKADFAVFETYHWLEPPPLPCALSIFGGRDDPQSAEMAGWAELVSGPVDRRLFDGGHFYPSENAAGLARALAEAAAAFAVA
jgi:surfactin synthase thioesterase subunit